MSLSRLATKTFLNDLLIRNLQPPAKGDVFVSDARTPGFGIRVTSRGIKSFYYRCRERGAARRIHLGQYPETKLAEARSLAEQKRVDLKATARANDLGLPQPLKGETLLFPEALEEYDVLYCAINNRPSTRTEKMRLLRSTFKEPWKAKTLASIARSDVQDIIDAIIKHGNPSAANHALQYVKSFFSYCVERGYLKVSPCEKYKKPAKAAERKRVLLPKEILAVWTAAHTHGFPYGTITQLALLTAQRRGEIAGMTWNEIDFDEKIWHIPPHRAKNNEPQDVPLSGMALSLLLEVKRLSELNETDSWQSDLVVFTECHEDWYEMETDYVFPARQSSLHVRSFSKPMTTIARLSKVPDWTLHDLRRTATTYMGKLGVPRLIQKKILNHSNSTVTDIYDRYDYLKERREALELWATHLKKLVTPK